MQIQIKLAETAGEADALFKLRHQIFVEEMAVLKATPDGRLYDRFDAYASTNNIIALHRGRVIGGIRLTRWTEAGMPAEEFFDVAPHVPALHQVGCAGMLCIEAGYRGRDNLAPVLVGTMCGRAAALGLSHVVSAINPAIERFLSQIGFERLGATNRDPKTQLPFIPMRLALAEIRDWFQGFAQQPEASLRMTRFEAETAALAA
jgi:N-acyl-L-homoserine lactone synthetase